MKRAMTGGRGRSTAHFVHFNDCHGPLQAGYPSPCATQQNTDKGTDRTKNFHALAKRMRPTLRTGCQNGGENTISSVYGASLFFNVFWLQSSVFSFHPSTDEIDLRTNIYHLLVIFAHNTICSSAYCRITQTGSESNTVTSA